MSASPGLVRFLGSIAIAIVAAAISAIVFEPRYALLIGPLVLGFTSVLWGYAATNRLTAEQTRDYAKREDLATGEIDTAVLLAAVGSLAAVGVALFTGTSSTRVIDSLLALAAAWASWAMIHGMYAIRYARMYYAEPVGGIDFNGDDEPVYADFRYFSFNLGMTYQVSDTNVRTTALRRVVLRHCLISFLFGTMIIAFAINLVVNVVG